MPKRKKKEWYVRLRTGKWSDPDAKDKFALDALPKEVQKLMEEANPDWDWVELKEWLVIRQYDEERETSRVAALVKARRLFD